MNTVPIYDFDTKVITEIPEAQLASGYIKVKVSGIDGPVFVEMSKLKQSDKIKHPPFDNETWELCEDFSIIFADVNPRTPAQWENGFRYDENPAQEIQVWEWIAGAYLHFTHKKMLPTESNRDYFHIILACANCGFDAALHTIELRKLSRARAHGVIRELRQLVEKGKEGEGPSTT